MVFGSRNGCSATHVADKHRLTTCFEVLGFVSFLLFFIINFVGLCLDLAFSGFVGEDFDARDFLALTVAGEGACEHTQRIFVSYAYSLNVLKNHLLAQISPCVWRLTKLWV